LEGKADKLERFWFHTYMEHHNVDFQKRYFNSSSGFENQTWFQVTHLWLAPNSGLYFTKILNPVLGLVCKSSQFLFQNSFQLVFTNWNWNG
jgi:hypothetical protein